MAYDNIIARADVQAMIREQVSDLMLEGLETASAARALFRPLTISSNQARFPVISALPVAYFVNGDTGLKQTTEAAWTNKYIDVEEIAAIVVIPDAVREDASFDIVGEVIPLLRGAVGRTLDAAIFFGVDAPASWPDDITTAAIAAGNHYFRGTNNAAAGGIAEDLNQLIGLMEDDGYAPTAFVSNSTLRRRLRGARDSQGQMLADVNGGVTNVWGLPTVYPMAGQWPATGDSDAELFGLQAQNFVLGVRKDFTVTFHTDGVITDNTGAIVYNLMQQDASAIRVVFRAGWQVSNPLNYQEATEADRYPAAVLRSPNV